ncbi:MAG: hypothetical protein GY835_28155, partial [bacterium]|nr:hypothetical protein [bacterium]
PDGTYDLFDYYPDDTLQWHLNRDGVEITFSYDDANRLLSAVPAPGGAEPLEETLVPLDLGTFYEYDEASRLKRASIGPNGQGPGTVEYREYDLVGRPAEEIVGNRDALVRTFDVWGRTARLDLPAQVSWGPGDPFSIHRTFDGLDRLTEIGAGPSGYPDLPDPLDKIGATWKWGGRDRLYRVQNNGPQAFTRRFNYIG